MSLLSQRWPRIALVIDRFDGRRGGAEYWTRGFAAWLAARGCDVHVLARSMGPAETLLPLTFHAIEGGRSPLAFSEGVARRIAEIEPLVSHDMGAATGCDVFQPHFGSGLACWEGSVASYVAWLRPVKRLCGLSPRYRRLRRSNAAQFVSGRAGSALFLAVSHKAARDMSALHGVDESRIRVVHNGVDLSRFTDGELEESRRVVRERYGFADYEVVIIAVGNHPRLKGIGQLVNAVKRLRRQGQSVRMLICGGRAERRAARDQQTEAVIRCGRVSDVAPFYAAADVCVHPTYYDACSLVTLEAMAAGLAVVTTRANGASELMRSGVNGLVLPAGLDSAALAAALRPIVENANLRLALGTAARQTVTAHTVERNYCEVVSPNAEAISLREAEGGASRRGELDAEAWQVVLRRAPAGAWRKAIAEFGAGTAVDRAA